MLTYVEKFPILISIFTDSTIDCIIFAPPNLYALLISVYSLYTLYHPILSQYFSFTQYKMQEDIGYIKYIMSIYHVTLP